MDDLTAKYTFKSRDKLLHFNSNGKYVGSKSLVSFNGDDHHHWMMRFVYKINNHFYINENWFIDIEWTDLPEATCIMYETMLESMSIVELCYYVNTLGEL
jgi:hypothetical protein